MFDKSNEKPLIVNPEMTKVRCYGNPMPTQEPNLIPIGDHRSFGNIQGPTKEKKPNGGQT